MKDRSRAAVIAGRWPWSAPLGYKNIAARDGANIVPDPKTAPHIHRAFELMSTGLYTQAQVLRTITDAGLRTRAENKLAPQTFYQTLRKKLYAGFIESSSIDEPVRGLHTALVTQQIFDRSQDVLDSKKARPPKKFKHNAAFPLKPFVRCAACGTPLTGGLAKSHTGKHYARYWCRTAGCRAVGLSREELESLFVELLRGLSPTGETQAEFPKIAAQVWAAGQSNAQLNMQKIQAELDKVGILKKKLLTAYLEGKVPEDDYTPGTSDYSRQIAELERQLRDTADVTASADTFVSFAQLQLTDLSGLWAIANNDQRRRVQTILFRSGLLYSPKTKSLNPDNSSLFNTLQEMNPENLRLASPTGFEPVLPP